MRIGLVPAACLFVGLGASLAATGGSARPDGAALYQRGESTATGEERSYALVGSPPRRAPFPLFPCANCHGALGRGGTEGGLQVPAITWRELTKPYDLQRSGRTRPAYDRDRFALALRAGEDPADRPLAPAMPRYQLSEDEVDALVAHLQALDEPLAPGVERDAILLGVTLPTGSRARREALRSTIGDYLDSVNEGGGVYGRRLHADFAEDAGPVLARLVLNLPTAPDGPPGAPGASDATPELALFADGSGTARADSRFAIYSGSDQRASALRVFAARHLGLADGELHAGGDGARGAPAWSSAVLYDGRDARALRRLVARLSDRDVPPVLLLSHWLESPAMMEAVRAYPASAFAAVPPTPSLASARGRRLYDELAKRYEWSGEHRMARVWALAGATVLVGALRDIGRDPHPRAVVAALASLYGHETGLGPDLTFVAGRRVGHPGALIVRVSDADRTPAGRPVWVSLESQSR